MCSFNSTFPGNPFWISWTRRFFHIYLQILRNFQTIQSYLCPLNSPKSRRNCPSDSRSTFMPKFQHPNFKGKNCSSFLLKKKKKKEIRFHLYFLLFFILIFCPYRTYIFFCIFHVITFLMVHIYFIFNFKTYLKILFFSRFLVSILEYSER